MTACIFHDTSASLHDRRIFEIVEDAYERHEKVVIYTPSDERAAEMDRLLWILRQDSFIPHQIQHKVEDPVSVSVVIITGEWKPFDSGILVADGRCSLPFACTFSLVHEFVDRSSPEIQQECRKRYREYLDQKIPVEYLKTGVWKGAVPK